MAYKQSGLSEPRELGKKSLDKINLKRVCTWRNVIGYPQGKNDVGL